MNQAQHEELKRLAAEAPSGLLTAESVVEHAKKEDSPLHELFEWDDSEAAKLFRVQQARQVIRAYVKYEPRTARKVRGLVSVPTDRVTTGGYRTTEQVLLHEEWVTQMVSEIAAKVRGLKDQYSYLPHLDTLWPRLNSVVDQFMSEMLTKKSAG